MKIDTNSNEYTTCNGKYNILNKTLKNPPELMAFVREQQAISKAVVY